MVTKMPVTFKCKSSPDIVMLDATANQLIKAMGHSGSVPGSIAAPDVEAALRHLETAIAQDPPAAAQAVTAADTAYDDAPVPISFFQRAGPMKAMLENALKTNDYIFWEQ